MHNLARQSMSSSMALKIPPYPPEGPRAAGRRQDLDSLPPAALADDFERWWRGAWPEALLGMARVGTGRPRVPFLRGGHEK